MLTVVIPTYNRRECLCRLLDDLLAQEAVRCQIVVVDDNSSDDTPEVVPARYPQVEYLRNPVNRGPTVSRNRGLAAARGEILLGLDSDVTLPDRQLLRRIEQEFARLPAMHALALRVFEPDGRTDDAPRWWHPVPLATHANQRFETDYFSGTAFAFRTEELRRVGGFSEAIFQYYEEVELAYRFLDAGGAILHVPDLAVRHHPGRRSGWSDLRWFHHPRSLVVLALACYPVPRGAMFLFPRLVKTFLQALATRRVRLFLGGVRSASAAVPDLWRHRRPLRPSTWRRIAALHH